MIWTNTSLFNSLLPAGQVTLDKSKATVIILGALPIDINEFPNVTFIFRAGVGTDNVNFPDIRPIRRIAVEFPSQETKNLIYEETANFTCYLIFKMLYDNLVKRGPDYVSWTSERRNILTNKRLLLLGLGNIGSRVLLKMTPFINNISTYDIRYDKVAPNYSEADIISLHVPLCEENKGFINKEILDQCKGTSILINTARGPIVNEDDLYDKLKHTEMRAAFDAFWDEPYTGKLTEFSSDKFFMTPHIASSSIEFVESCYKDFKTLYDR